ncbi:MAG: hypothetical protein ACNA78_05790 [Balneolaceae bacterium]
MHRRNTVIAVCWVFGIVLILSAGVAVAQDAGDGAVSDAGMTQADLERIAWEEGAHAEGLEGLVQFVYNDVPMLMLSDPTFDRMRIIAPIMEQVDMTQRQMMTIIEANFEATLDARYATNNGILYAAYIHPLGPLTREQVISGMRQVSALVLNFGGSYSSDEISYLQSQQ